METLSPQSSGPELEPKQKKFCEEYLADRNATQAAIRAGYSPNNAAKQGFRILLKPQAQAYIRQMETESIDVLGLANCLIVHELEQLTACTNTHDFIDETGNLKNLNELTDEMQNGVHIQSKEVLVEGQVVTLNTRKLLNRMDTLNKICRNLNTINGKKGVSALKSIRIFGKTGPGKTFEI